MRSLRCVLAAALLAATLIAPAQAAGVVTLNLSPDGVTAFEGVIDAARRHGTMNDAAMATALYSILLEAKRAAVQQDSAQAQALAQRIKDLEDELNKLKQKQIEPPKD